MKKYIKRGVVGVLAFTIVLSCKDSFLDVPVSGRVSSAQLTSKAGIEGVLLSSYSELNGHDFGWLGGASNWLFGSINGGEANKGSNSGDYTSMIPVERFELLPSNELTQQKWSACYEGIARANATLVQLKSAGSDVTAEDVKRISGEARFLRGHYYFELKKVFGNGAPYVDETKDLTTIGKVANGADLWPFIEADFKYAMDNLPEIQTAAGRANKWAAASYLAKTYLFEKKYTDAQTLFTSIITNGKNANGVKYALLTKYADAFNAASDNSAESVFAVQAAANTGDVNNANPDLVLNFPYNTGTNGPAGCCGFFPPSFELANSFRTDTKGLPLLDGSYNSAENALKTDQGLQSSAAFTPEAGNVDPRLDHSVGRRGIPYLDWMDHPGFDWIRDQGYAGPYSPKKFVYYKSQVGTLQDGSSWTGGYTAMNYNIIRYSDVLLMAAEAEIEVGSLATAQGYVNQVRSRAANPSTWVQKGGKPAANYVIGTYTGAWDKATARTAVQMERKLELSGEGHRFFDLVRWGIASTAMNAYFTYESKQLPNQFGGAKFTAGVNEVMPIPQSQIDIQGKDVLKQNTGY